MSTQNYPQSFIGFAVALISIVTISNHSKAQTVLKRPPSTITVDGATGEWGTLPLFDSDTKIKYNLANDDSCLYVVLYTYDPQSKRKLIMAGVTVSVNTEGKKRKTYSLTYPLPKSRGEGSPAATMVTSGFKGVQNNISAAANNYGFKAAFKFNDDGGMGYEMAIPLKMLTLKPDKSNDIFVNIALNGVESRAPKNSSDAGDSPAGGSRGGGRGGSRGGSGSSGPPSGGGNEDDSGMADSQDFWVKLTLAK